VEAGKLRRRIKIYLPQQVDLDSGGFKETWVFSLKVWGEVTPLTGKEYFDAKQVDSQVTHKIRIRYNLSGINSSCRLVHKDQIFEVSYITNSKEDNQEFIVMAIERTGVIKDTVAGMNNQMTIKPLTLQWGQIDLTQVQNIVFSIPDSAYFIPKSLSGFVSVLTGNVLTQPIVNLGIPGNHTKFLLAKPFSQLLTLLSSQEFTTLLTDDGVTSIWLEILTGGSVDAGSYRGMLFVVGNEIIGA
jgi:SPP1 family predicted phage head-tail adaptor